MPRRLSPLLLILLALLFTAPFPMAFAQDTGSQRFLDRVKERKSIVRLEADELERRERDKLTIARGDVRIQMEERALYADEVELDQVQEVVRAKGRVQLIEGASRLEGERFEYHYRTNTGVMYQARGAVPPATAFRGVEIHKEGERTYRLVEGSVTTCRICQPEPGGVDWEVRAKEAVLEQNEYLTAKSASFWVRDIPSLYIPYLIYPLGERRTGFLLPRIGYSDRDGFTYKQPFFWAIDESQDLTLTGVYRARRGIEGEANYRYILGPEARGSVDVRVIQDRLTETEDEVRATVVARHDQQFNPELSLKADINYYSDRTIQREFAETPSELRTANLSNSRVFLTQLWQHYGLQFMVEESRSLTETGTPDDSRLRRLPDLTFSAFPRRLFGSPLLLEMRASGTYLESEVVPDAGRVDLFPKASVPWRVFPWLTMTPSVGFRETAYTKRGDGEGGISRELFEAQGSLESRFYRSFKIGGERVDRLVHLVEPRVSYWYVNPVDQQEIPQFDNVDFVSPQNRVTYSLTNRLLAKMKEADGSTRTHEVASLSLSQSYNLDPKERTFSNLYLNALTPERIDQAVREEINRPPTGFSTVQERRFSNLVAAVRASPFQHLAFQGLAAINTEEHRVDGIEAGVRYTYPEYGSVELAHTFIRDRETAGVVGRFLLTPIKNVAINYLTRYDTFRDTSLENNVVVTYSTCCWMMGIQYINRSVTPERGSEDSVHFFFELLTGGAPVPPERGAQQLMRR